MSKAEERALEAYPSTSHYWNAEPDRNAEAREFYIQGYHQAEKDLTDKARLSSGWDGFYYGQGYKQAEKDLELKNEDVYDIWRIYNEVCLEGKILGFDETSQEVLKRFKERKEK